MASTTSYTGTVGNGTAYARLTRTALAANDSAGGATGVVGQTNAASFTLASTAPPVANAIANQSATCGAAFSFAFATNVFTEADAAHEHVAVHLHGHERVGVGATLLPRRDAVTLGAPASLPARS